MAQDNTISETASSVGGWFGDLMEGIKPAAVDALGFTIRNKAGLLDQEQYYRTTAPVQPQPSAAPAPTQSQDNQGIILVALGVVAFMILADDD